MTCEEAVEILKRRHIELDVHDPSRLVLRDGQTPAEQVGEINRAASFIYIAEYIPSQTGMTYSQVYKSFVLLDSPRAHIRLETLLNDLATSAQRYEQSIRDEKIKNVQQYFRKRNMKRSRSFHLTHRESPTIYQTKTSSTSDRND